MARLCQSLVMGMYTHSLDPKNDYLLLTQNAGWKILEELWKMKDAEALEIWKNKADQYLTQSTK